MASTLIALAERLRKHSRVITRQTDARNPFAADLRYAATVVRHMAALRLAEEARRENNHQRRRALEQEAASLWTGARP